LGGILKAVILSIPSNKIQTDCQNGQHPNRDQDNQQKAVLYHLVSTGRIKLSAMLLW
jgi:hypothetical protein